MEVTIEKLKKINGQDSKPKSKKTLAVSDLKLHALSIATPVVPAAADVAEDVNEYFSDYDGYYTEEEEKKPVAAPKPEVVEEEEGGGVYVDMVDKDVRLQAYTVHVDGHRILTVSTYSNTVAARWIREVLGCCRKKKSGEIVVGVCVDREHPRYEKRGLRDSQYDIIQLCVGSQCLIYELPEWGEVRDGSFPLTGFFADRRVVAAGFNMNAVAKKLFKDHEIRFSNVLDLNELAEEVLENSYQLDLKRYDLDRLGTTALGKNWYIDRPTEKRTWFPTYWYWSNRGLGMEKVKYSTYDAYLSYMIGAKLLEMKSEKMSAASAGKKGNRKKGNTNN